MCPSHTIIQVVKVVALPWLQFLLKMLVCGRLVLIGKVDGVDEEGIVCMLWPMDFLSNSTLFWQILACKIGLRSVETSSII